MWVSAIKEKAVRRWICRPKTACFNPTVNHCGRQRLSVRGTCCREPVTGIVGSGRGAPRVQGYRPQYMFIRGAIPTRGTKGPSHLENTWMLWFGIFLGGDRKACVGTGPPALPRELYQKK